MPNKRLNQNLQLKENVATVKSLSDGSEKMPSLKAEPLNSIKPIDIDINKSIESVKPQRTQFKSSFGYGKLQKQTIMVVLMEEYLMEWMLFLMLQLNQHHLLESNKTLLI